MSINPQLTLFLRLLQHKKRDCAVFFSSLFFVPFLIFLGDRENLVMQIYAT
jgi:hypothetical protein